MESGDLLGEVTDLKPGNHICCFYKNEKDHKKLITSYIIHGLEKGEKVLYILDKHDLETITRYLKETVNVKDYIQTGQLVFLYSKDVYTPKGFFKPELMLRNLQKIYDETLKQGYSALRGTGEMSWILNGIDSFEKLLEYENKLNDFLKGKKFYALCQYNINDFNKNFLLDILLFHPLIAIGPKIYNNFYYIPTEEYKGNIFPDSTFDSWIENLKSRGRYEEQLKISRKRYKNLFENSPISLWEGDFSQGKQLIDDLKVRGVKNFQEYFDQHPETVQKLAKTVKIVDVNKKTLELYDADNIAEFKNYLPHLFTPKSIEIFKKELVSIANNKKSFYGEAVTKTLKGDKKFVMLNFFASPGYDHDYSKVIISIIDLTHHKKIEDELKDANHKNEMLLKEIHHRVKNNMQIISSILNLQSLFLEDKNLQEALNDCKNRVKSMGFIHEKLYSSGDFSQINMEDYVNTLSAEIFKSYRASTHQLTLEMDIENIKLDINQAIPTGLIINELLTNSIKYAFPHKKGHIKIKIKAVNGSILMWIKDDGIGFPTDFDIVKTETLGLQLVSSLVSQLEGTISLDKSKGTEFFIKFPYRA